MITPKKTPLEALVVKAGLLTSGKKSDRRTRRLTGLSASRTRRVIRRVLVSDPDRKWVSSDFAQALDPRREINPGTLNNMIKAEAASVARSIRMVTIRDGRRVVFTSRTTAEQYYLGRMRVTDETRIEEAFQSDERAWSLAELAGHLHPHEAPEQHVRHTSLNPTASRVAARLGWLKFRDPNYAHRMLFAPPSIAAEMLGEGVPLPLPGASPVTLPDRVEAVLLSDQKREWLIDDIVAAIHHAPFAERKIWVAARSAARRLGWFSGIRRIGNKPRRVYVHRDNATTGDQPA